MGIFSFLAKSFADGFRGSLERQQEAERKQIKIPVRDLLYPGELPSFTEIAEGGHEDVRALAYVIRYISPQRKRPITSEDFDTGDFDSRVEACCVLQKRGLVRELPKVKVLTVVYEKDDLKRLLRLNGLPVSGNKPELAERLIGAGVKIDSGRYRRKLYELTEEGARIVSTERQKKSEAIKKATVCLKEDDYQGAIGAYRAYDREWGFEHSSGKKHTIFAHYDIPCERFYDIERYSMNDLQNTEDFKRTLRACLIAGLMRGCQDKAELAGCFTELCGDPIHCAKLMDYYRYGDFEEDDSKEIILARMQENILHDNQNALEYYIAHILRNIRRA